jgi:hypothetical protein
MKKVVRITQQDKVKEIPPASLARGHLAIAEGPTRVALIQAVIPVAMAAVGETR